jgi:hypothetical protein
MAIDSTIAGWAVAGLFGVTAFVSVFPLDHPPRIPRLCPAPSRTDARVGSQSLCPVFDPIWRIWECAGTGSGNRKRALRAAVDIEDVLRGIPSRCFTRLLDQSARDILSRP